MIVVDASVWICHFRNELSGPVRKLRSLESPRSILVGDLTLLECLQGARDDSHARRFEGLLRAFPVVRMFDSVIAVETARNYRLLRSRGVTPRKQIDLIIATFCIREGHDLLHQDRDFDAMVTHLGLRVA